MKTIIAIAVLLTLSASKAVPIVGTEQKVSSSVFCKKYQCKLIENSEDTYPDGYVNYTSFKVKTYLLKNGLKLITYGIGNSEATIVGIRDSGSSLKHGLGNINTLTNDFFLTFVGKYPAHECKTTNKNPYYQGEGVSIVGDLGSTGGYGNLCFIVAIPDTIIKLTIYVAKTK